MAEDTMPGALRFLLAARRCELQRLEDLVHTCELVSLISQLVHALQKERGYANIFLGGLPVCLTDLDERSAQAIALEQAVRMHLDHLDADAVQGTDKARLFNRIAYVLYRLDELPALRRCVREQRLAAVDATSAFTRLIGGLLAVVFEAADTALDPDITRALVAMFNFMQGKELAGQERAGGVAGFSAGFFNETQQRQMQQFVDGQQRCFDVFCEYAEAPAIALWEALIGEDVTHQVQQLRLMGQRTHASARVDSALGEVWFALCTQRIDGMKRVESCLAQALLHQCRHSIALASADLENHRALFKRLDPLGTTAQPVLFSVQGSTLEDGPQDGVGTQLGRSILDVMHAQTQRLQELGDELNQARSTLNERKRIEQAKHLLMRQYQLSEQAAYEHLQRAAMDKHKRLIEVADLLLAHADCAKSV